MYPVFPSWAAMLQVLWKQPSSFFFFFWWLGILGDLHRKHISFAEHEEYMVSSVASIFIPDFVAQYFSMKVDLYFAYIYRISLPDFTITYLYIKWFSYLTLFKHDHYAALTYVKYKFKLLCDTIYFCKDTINTIKFIIVAMATLL